MMKTKSLASVLTKNKFVRFSQIFCIIILSILLILSNINQKKNYTNIFQNQSQQQPCMDDVQNIYGNNSNTFINNVQFSKINTDLPKNKQQNLAKIAYLIFSSQGESEKVIQLLNKIIYRENIYLIHVDKKTGAEEVHKIFQHAKNLNETYQNIYFLNQFQSSYLGISLVDIEITAMAYALSISMHWTHYINLSPSHYPLLSQKQIQIILGKIQQNISFMGAKIMPCRKVNFRFQHILFDGALTGFNTNQQIFTKYVFPHPKNLKILKGSQWRIFSRDMAQYFAHSEDGFARRILLLSANSMIPNEHYFQTAICNSPIVKNSVRIAKQVYLSWENINWEERSGLQLGPREINENLLEIALRKGTIFARKFGTDEESQNLKFKLDELHAGKEIRVMNKTYTKKSVFQTALGYYLNAIKIGQTCEDLIKKANKKQPCKLPTLISRNGTTKNAI